MGRPVTTQIRSCEIVARHTEDPLLHPGSPSNLQPEVRPDTREDDFSTMIEQHLQHLGALPGIAPSLRLPQLQCGDQEAAPSSAQPHQQKEQPWAGGEEELLCWMRQLRLPPLLGGIQASSPLFVATSGHDHLTPSEGVNESSSGVVRLLSRCVFPRLLRGKVRWIWWWLNWWRSWLVASSGSWIGLGWRP